MDVVDYGIELGANDVIDAIGKSIHALNPKDN